MNVTTVPFLTAILVAIFTVPSQAQSLAAQAESLRLQLRELRETLPQPEDVGRKVELDIAAIQNLANYRQHVKEVFAKFEADIKKGQQPFANLGYTIEGLKNTIEMFEAAARDYGSTEKIQADLDHVLKMAKQAVEYQAPAYFLPENDIGIRTESAKVRIRYLESFAPQSVELKAVRQKMTDTCKQVAAIQESLSAKILEQNELPPDTYQRDDREKLLKLVRAKWDQAGNKAQILKVGLVGADWNRSVSWEIQNRTLYKLDRSRLQGYVLVALNEKVAVRHDINLIQDHSDNNSIRESLLNDPAAKPELIYQILRTKIQ